MIPVAAFGPGSLEALGRHAIEHSGRVPVLAHSAPGLRLPQALEKNREEENTARATRHLPGIATCDREAEAL